MRYKDMTPEQRREYHRAAQRKHYQKHRENLLEDRKSYYWENREDRLDYQRAYHWDVVKPKLDATAEGILESLAALPEENRQDYVRSLLKDPEWVTEKALQYPRVDSAIAPYVD